MHLSACYNSNHNDLHLLSALSFITLFRASWQPFEIDTEYFVSHILLDEEIEMSEC